MRVREGFRIISLEAAGGAGTNSGGTGKRLLSTLLPLGCVWVVAAVLPYYPEPPSFAIKEIKV